METPKYIDKFELMNRTERELFRRLQEAAPALLIFAQVSMSQLFWITRKRKNSFLQVNEIGRKSVDFLLCDPDDTSIVMAVELNGPTHEKEHQRQRDEVKQRALEEAGIPLAVFTPDNIPDVKQLRHILAPHIVKRTRYEAEKRERLKNKH